MQLNRREFGVLGISLIASACGGGSPTSPTPTQTTPATTSTPPSSSRNYIYSGQNTSGRQISLLDAIAQHSPLLDPPLGQPVHPLYQDRFVRGLGGFQIQNLVFYIDDQRYEDLGVTRKMLSPGQRWGCISASS
jgi:hypothetical protein